MKKVFINEMDDFSKQLEYPYTPAQWRAISINGIDVLVSAAAGSGKTAVLSERIVKQVYDNKWDIDKLLVLTFTKAAAKNMSDRIEKKIIQRLNFEKDYENKEHLEKQKLLMNNASISTIDSFCLDLLKKFYYLVEEKIFDKTYYLSPDFKVLSNNKFLLDESIKETLEKYYKEKNDKLDILFDIFGKKQGILEFLKKIYSKVQIIPNYRSYIKNGLTDNIKELVENFDNQNYKIINLIDNNNFYEIIETNFKELEFEILALKKFFEKEKSIDEKIEQILKNSLDIENFAKFNEKLKSDNCSISSAELKENISFIYKKIFENNSVSGEEAKEIVEKIEIFKDIIFQYNRLINLEEVVKDLLLNLDSTFILKKRNSNYLDFSDLNHLTINALEKFENGKRVLTEASRYYRNFFKEIYVDEYQDNNDLQEYILNLVRGEDVYFFRVGDVKQSIYGFRGSNPNLFEEKYVEYSKLSDYLDLENYDINKKYEIKTNSSGICVVLKENFRSDENILKSSNFIFNRLMYKKNAGISYDLDSALYYPKIKEKSNNKLDTVLLNFSKQNFKVISYIVKEIKKQVLENSSLNYSDFAILVRSRSSIIDYKNVFDEYNIPVFYKDLKGFRVSNSFNIIFNLFKFIDNNNLDVSLLVILKSEIFDYSNNELLELSLVDGDYLFEKLANSDKLKDKNTLNILNKWINFALNNSSYDLLKQVVWDSSFLDYMSKMNFDDIELDYFNTLLSVVENSSLENKNLSYTIEILDKIKKEDKYDVNITGNKNSVVISTIHNSKGLEYKNVFVVDLHKNFTKETEKEKFSYSKELGLTFGINNISNFKKLSILHNFNVDINNKKLLEEEIRVLYVAITRAKSNLYLSTNGINKFPEKLEDGNYKEQIISESASFKSFNDMLISVFKSYDKNENYDETEKDVKFEIVDVENMDIEEYESDAFNKDYNIEESCFLDNEIMELDFFKNSSLEKRRFYPAKTSYSIIKKFNSKFDKISDNKNENLTFKNYRAEFSSKYSVLKGNVIHKLFERMVLDISNGVCIKDVRKYIFSLKFTNDRYSNIKEKRIFSDEEFVVFSEEGIFKKIEMFVFKIRNFVNVNTKVETEVMFTNLSNVRNLFDNSDNEDELIVQGIIDLLVIDGNNYYLIDYKTDYVSDNDGRDLLKERHSEQLNLYSKAIYKFYGDNINVKKYIYSFVLGEFIEV